MDHLHELKSLYSSISTQYYPNADAVARKLSSNIPAHQQQLINFAKACVEPAYKYFNDKFGNDLAITVSAFQVFDPVKISELKPSSSDIDNLKVFPFLSTCAQLVGLKMELLTYMAKADGASSEVNKWWKKHETNLPNWSRACKSVLLRRRQQQSVLFLFYPIVLLIDKHLL